MGGRALPYVYNPFPFTLCFFPFKLNSKVFETQGPLKTPLSPTFTSQYEQQQKIKVRWMLLFKHV